MPLSVRIRYVDAEITVLLESPNTTMTEVLQKAKEILGLPNHKSYSLKYQRKKVDLLLSFRLSGILANSVLELCEEALAEAVPRAATILVAIEFGEGTSRLEGRFPSKTTLLSIITQLCPNIEFVCF